MKKLIYLIPALALFLSVETNGQKVIKEGKAEYELTYEGIDEQYAPYMPKATVVYFKDDKARTEMMLPMGMTQIIIYDGVKKETIMLQDMMGKKSAIKMDNKDEKAEQPAIKNTEESKTIAGYKCTKSIVTDAEGNSVDVWVTKEIIAARDDSQFKGVDGFVMEATISMEKQGIEGTMIMTVKNVTTDKVAEKMFEVPADYKIMTQDEYKKMMSGGAGGSDE